MLVHAKLVSHKRYKKTLLSVTLALIGATQPQFVFGNNSIQYTDTNSDALVTAPTWFNGYLTPITDAFVGNNSGVWLSSDSTVIIDYTPGSKTAPSYVVGGVGDPLVNRSDVHRNAVIMDNGHVTNSVYGGWSRFSWGDGAWVTDNTVTINAGQVDGEVLGGSADGWGSVLSVKNNKVQINAATVGGTVRGGYAYGNSLTASQLDVDDNIVEVIGGTVSGEIYGGSVTGGSASDDTTIISAKNNRVTLTNATVAPGQNVYGGFARHEGSGSSRTATASNNTVMIEGGNLNVANIYGGYVGAEIATATNNRIDIQGTPTFDAALTSIYGGWLDSTYTATNMDVFTGNTLNVSTNSSFAVKNMGNFQHYNFSLEPTLAGSSTALVEVDNITFGNNAANDSNYVAGNSATYKTSNFNVIGANSGNTLQLNQQFILVQNNSGNIDPNTITIGTNGTGINKIQQGASLYYDVHTIVNGNQIITTVVSVAPTVNSQLKALMEGRLGAAMLVTRGADGIAYGLSSFLGDQDHVNGFTPFIDIRTGTSRYNSGSHVSQDEHLLTTGLAYKYNNLSAALAYEHGWGSYDSYNGFNTGNVKGSGHNQYYGLAMLARYTLNNGLYADGSFRFGRLKNKFDTSDIRNAVTGERAKYSINSGYKSAHAGLGYVYNLNSNQKLDISAKYLWTRTPAVNKTIAGDEIHFDSLNSHRVRVNALGTQQLNKDFAVSLGLGYEYEFDGKQGGTTYDIYKIKKASVKGGTGIASLALDYQPTRLKNLSVKTALQGYAGKRQGASVSLTVAYGF